MPLKIMSRPYKVISPVKKAPFIQKKKEFNENKNLNYLLVYHKIFATTFYPRVR